ncbi:MAG TPA: hypothetical protein VM536_20595, partial [Chloroflexia bacterium]|nr:hypothetical protein [Chloroflexia bacterium]
MYFRSLLGRSWALIRQSPGFLAMGFMLALGSRLQSNLLPGQWQSAIALFGLILLIWLTPRATAAIVAGTAYAAETQESLSRQDLWQLGAAKSGPVRRFLFLLVLLGTFLGFVLAVGLLGLILSGPRSEPGSALGDPADGAGLWLATFIGALLAGLGISLYALTTEALVLEDRTFYPALGRALRFIARHFAAVLVMLALMTGLALLSSGLISLAVTLAHVPDLRLPYNSQISPLLYAMTIVRWLVLTLITAPIATLGLVLWTLFYIDREPLTWIPRREAPVLAADTTPAASRSRARTVMLAGLAAIILGMGLLQVLAAQERAQAHVADIRPTRIAQQPGIVEGLDLSPDGRTLVTCTGNPFDADHDVRLWDVDSAGAPPKAVWPHPGGCSAVAFSPDGAWLASADQSGNVQLWSPNHVEAAATVIYTSTTEILSLAWSPDGHRLAFVDIQGRLQIENPLQPAKPEQLGDIGGVSDRVAFSPDSMALAGTGGSLRLWDLQQQPPTLRTVGAVPPNVSFVRVVAFSPDGALLATGETDISRGSVPAGSDTTSRREQVLRLRDAHNPEQVRAT